LRSLARWLPGPGATGYRVPIPSLRGDRETRRATFWVVNLSPPCGVHGGPGTCRAARAVAGPTNALTPKSGGLAQQGLIKSRLCRLAAEVGTPKGRSARPGGRRRQNSVLCDATGSAKRWLPVVCERSERTHKNSSVSCAGGKVDNGAGRTRRDNRLTELRRVPVGAAGARRAGRLSRRSRSAWGRSAWSRILGGSMRVAGEVRTSERKYVHMCGLTPFPPRRTYPVG
jgi:hypothetical protein